jgi:hypothetical protein
MTFEEMLSNAAKKQKRNVQKTHIKPTDLYFNTDPIQITPEPKKRKRNDTEAQLQDSIAKELNARGFMVMRLNSGAMQGNQGQYFRAYFIYGLKKSSGASDLIVFRDGKAWFIEVKTATGRQSESQKAFQEYAESKKMSYFLIKNLEDIQKFLKFV